MNQDASGGQYNHGGRHGYRGLDRIPLASLVGVDAAQGQILVYSAAAGDWVPLDAVAPVTAGYLNTLGIATGETTPTWKAAEHNLLSVRHLDTLAGTVVDGDSIQGNVTPKWARVPISIPSAAALLNVWGLVTGELRATWKALFNNTLPVAITPGGAGAAGVSTLASHLDHDHPSTNVASAATLAALAARTTSYEITANQVLTSGTTVMQSVTNMNFSILANEVWMGRFMVDYNSVVAANIHFQIISPAASAGEVTLLGQLGAVNVIHLARITTPKIFDGIAAPLHCEILFTIQNGANAGAVQLQAAQSFADAGATSILAGTSFLAQKVA